MSRTTWIVGLGVCIVLGTWAGSSRAQDSCEQACAEQEGRCIDACGEGDDPIECEAACRDDASDCVERCRE